jgi:hypothetical protein
MEILRRIWDAIPLKIVLLVTALGLASTKLHPDDGKTYPKGEFYPLSSYPMYSSFRGHDYYVYLADAEGEPVPCKDFGLTTPKLKKRFKGELKAAKLSESELRERRLAPEKIGPIAAKVLERVAGARRDGAQLQPGDEVTMRLVYIFKGEGGAIEDAHYRVAGATVR